MKQKQNNKLLSATKPSAGSALQVLFETALRFAAAGCATPRPDETYNQKREGSVIGPRAF